MTRRALIVDDHRLFAEAVSPILERLGFDVSSAVDAQEAAAQVSATRPSLIVIDIGLPGEDGLSLGRRLLEESGDLTVIAVTAADDPGLDRVPAGRVPGLRDEGHVGASVRAGRACSPRWSGRHPEATDPEDGRVRSGDSLAAQTCSRDTSRPTRA